MIFQIGIADAVDSKSRIILHTTDREMHFFYGARALGEAFFLEDFWELEKEFPNFHFHLSLDRPDPKADEAALITFT